MRWFVCAASFVLVVDAAHASPAEIPVRIESTLATSCRRDIDFEAKLSVRSPIVVAEDAPTVLRFEVAPSETNVGFAARLSVETAAGVQHRSLEAATCTDAIDALVIVASLALAAKHTSVAEAPVAPPPVAQHQLRAENRAEVPEHESASPISVGVGTGLIYQLLPNRVESVSIFGEALIGGTTVRFGGTATDEDVDTSSNTASRFRFVGGKLAVARWRLSSKRLSVVPAVTMDVGVIRASVMNTATYRPWIAPGGAVRLRYGAQRMGVELEVSAGFALVRDRFLVGTTVVRSEVTAATGVALHVVVALP